MSPLSDCLVRSALPRPALAALVATLALSACASDDLPETQLGNTSDLLVEAAPAPVVPERIPVATDADGVDPFLFGDWVGKAEDLFSASNADGSRPTYVFPSGSSDIFLRLDPSLGAPGSDGLSTVRFGQPEAPVPEVGVAYGAGINYYLADIFHIAGSPSYPPVEGVGYKLWQRELLLGGDYPALGFAFSPEDAFVEWCPLQPSLPAGDGQFNCVGAGGWGGGDPDAGEPCNVTLPDGSDEPMECNYVTLCASLACQCDESGCRAQSNEPLSELWIAREGDQLLGFVSRAVFDHGNRKLMPIGTIRFTRVEP